MASELDANSLYPTVQKKKTAMAIISQYYFNPQNKQV